jgi:hypothetical protein
VLGDRDLGRSMRIGDRPHHTRHSVGRRALALAAMELVVRWLLRAQLLTVVAGLHLPSAASAGVRRCGEPRMNFFDKVTNNLKQMSDQRVARLSHVMLRTDPAALNVRTKGEAYELLSAWAEVIGDDEERFARCARERSECQSKDKGGDLGYKTRASLNREFCDVAFGEEPGKVYGPLETESGLHLIYLHSCREPEGQATFPEWMVKAGLAKNE